MTLVVPDQHIGPSALASGLLAVMLLGASAPAAAIETVTIRSCYDGDTCRTTTGEKIRLACIDTPELRGKRLSRNEPKLPAITCEQWSKEGLSVFAGSPSIAMAGPSVNCSSMG